MHWGESPPCFPLIMGNCELIKLIWGNPYDPPSCHLSSFYWKTMVLVCSLNLVACMVDGNCCIVLQLIQVVHWPISISTGRGGSCAGKTGPPKPHPPKYAPPKPTLTFLQMMQLHTKNQHCKPPLPSFCSQWNDTWQWKRSIVTSNLVTDFQCHFFISIHCFRSILHYQCHHSSTE